MAGVSTITLALIGGICISGAIAGAMLKRAADLSHAGLFGLALLIYSASSFGLFCFYRFESEASFALTTFACLLGTLLTTQIISAAFLHEPINWRAFVVLLVAICAFVWAIQPGSAPNPDPNPTPQFESEAT